MSVDPSIAARPPFLNSTRGARGDGDGAREVRLVADQQAVAAPGGQLGRVEVAAAQGVGHLDLDPERLAGQSGGLFGADLGARQAGVDVGAERGQCRARGSDWRSPLGVSRREASSSATSSASPCRSSQIIRGSDPSAVSGLEESMTTGSVAMIDG